MAKVPKWEYRTWRDTRDFTGVHKATWTWSDPAVLTAINSLGQEGWEAVGLFQVDDAVGILFKRDTGKDYTLP
jgi:hypothetical protein